MYDINVNSLNTMIEGYEIHDYKNMPLKSLIWLNHMGTNHKNKIFVCVLLVYNHVSLLDEGYKYFNNMSESYCTIPRMRICWPYWLCRICFYLYYYHDSY